MLSVTKIFRFEMGHAINEYEGKCRHIHGHSYLLHVTVGAANTLKQPIPAPGFVIDFKELKKIVQEQIVEKLDHALVLSESYIKKHPQTDYEGQNLIVWKYEPSAENILFTIRQQIQETLSEQYKLVGLKLWETANSFVDWKADD